MYLPTREEIKQACKKLRKKKRKTIPKREVKAYVLKKKNDSYYFDRIQG